MRIRVVMSTLSTPTKLSWMPEDASTYYELWLRGAGRAHDPASVDAFAKAHRRMSGRQIDVLERGYQSWLEREQLPDSAEAFGRFIEPRYRRWRDTVLQLEFIDALATARRGRTLAA